MELTQEGQPVDQQTSTRSQVFAVRVTEAVVIAIVAAALSVWGTTQVLSERMNNMSQSLNRVEGRVDEIYRDIYAPRFEPRPQSHTASLTTTVHPQTAVDNADGVAP